MTIGGAAAGASSTSAAAAAAHEEAADECDAGDAGAEDGTEEPEAEGDSGGGTAALARGQGLCGRRAARLLARGYTSHGSTGGGWPVTEEPGRKRQPAGRPAATRAVLYGMASAAFGCAGSRTTTLHPARCK